MLVKIGAHSQQTIRCAIAGNNFNNTLVYGSTCTRAHHTWYANSLSGALWYMAHSLERVVLVSCVAKDPGRMAVAPVVTGGAESRYLSVVKAWPSASADTPEDAHASLLLHLLQAVVSAQCCCWLLANHTFAMTHIFLKCHFLH